jgi:transposase
VDRAQHKDTAPTPDAKPAHSAIEIDIAGGHRLRIIGGYDPEALAGLIRGLSA